MIIDAECKTLEDVKNEFLYRTLEGSGWNRGIAAKRAGVSVRTIRVFIERCILGGVYVKDVPLSRESRARNNGVKNIGNSSDLSRIVSDKARRCQRKAGEFKIMDIDQAKLEADIDGAQLEADTDVTDLERGE